MPSYISYLKTVMDAEWHEEDHPRDEDGKFTEGGGVSLGTALQEVLTNKKAEYGSHISSQTIELGVSKLKTMRGEKAVKAIEQIVDYTRSPDKGDRKLIDEAIWDGTPYNYFTYSGIEAEFDKGYKIGDDVGGRLISWSKDWGVAAQFSNKLLFIKKNPGLDIEDISAEPDEQEVLTATDMSFIVKDIRNINGLTVLEVEYKGKKQ